MWYNITQDIKTQQPLHKEKPMSRKCEEGCACGTVSVLGKSTCSCQNGAEYGYLFIKSDNNASCTYLNRKLIWRNEAVKEFNFHPEKAVYAIVAFFRILPCTSYTEVHLPRYVQKVEKDGSDIRVIGSPISFADFLDEQML
jgi:hypothetical protein